MKTKTIKITLGIIILIGMMCVENPAVCLTAAGTALGWLYYETKNSKRYGKRESISDN